MTLEEEMLKKLNKIFGKFMATQGLPVWGAIVKTAQGDYRVLYVDDDGKLVVSASISGSVDVSDRWARQLGQIDIARYLGSAVGLANPLHSQIVYGGAVIDPRQIRALSKDTDTIAVYGDLDILKQRTGTKELLTWVANIVQIAGSEGTAINSYNNKLYVIPFGSADQALRQHATSYDLLVELRKDAVAYDARDRNWNLGASDIPDLSDRATRLLGVIYGDQGQLAQRATTRDAYVQLRHAGTEIDPRVVTDVQKVVSPSYLEPSSLPAGGTAIVASAPGVGYKLRLKRLQCSVDAATRIDFRWGTNAFESYFLPTNGSVVINKIGENFDGPENTALTLYSLNAATVTASASTETLAV